MTIGGDWSRVREWRKGERERLLAGRRALPAGERHAAAEAIARTLEEIVTAGRRRMFGGYWPIKSELDFRALFGRLDAAGIAVALPVVVEPKQPLEYWRWRPGMAMARGFWNIPVPAVREPVQPDIVIAPLVGFDREGYRLGYGGGYFDRTLAALQSRPYAVGVGLEMMRLETIQPQPHDIPMALIVTENGRLSTAP
jgi:5-formyltetrahydrofolate cyclo-ligase